ncbi:MAG: helix-turn-helix domain-containing protein [Candidatus Aminicenantes bacterium]|nr:helix-turn-helix domain-containing protein [Candidatus Aminicenantes bacterium]
MGKRINFAAVRHLFAVIIISQLLGGNLFGLDPGKKAGQYLMDQWKISAGIPSDTINSITQTPDGYLWIGTTKGLVRFDGVTFSIKHFAGKKKTYPLEIRSLFVDSAGNLWIGRADCLTLYRYQTGRFKTFTGSDGITADGVRRIKDDMRGNLWISFTTGCVNRFYNGEFFAYNASDGLEGKKINAIVEDRRGNLLFGTRENGIFTYEDGEFFEYALPGLDNVIIISMYEDHEGDLWIGTISKGLFRVTGKRSERYTTANGLTNDFITSIIEDSDRNLWIGTRKGLNRIKKKKDGTIGFESLLQSFAINCLFEDVERNLWIGTDNSGIRKLKDGKFISYEPFKVYPEETPLSLFEDRHGDTWTGTISGKLFRFRGQNLIESVALPGLSGTGIAAVAEDAEGNLWLGTIGKGVFQKKNGNFVQFTTVDGLADNLVTSITKDSRDNLWFGTFDGVSVRRSANGVFESFTSSDGLSGKRAHNVYEDTSRNVWIAADKGITVLKDGKITKQHIEYYLRDIPVTCICEDLDSPAGGGSIFWIATDGAGLKRIKNGKFFSYNNAHGMTTDFIYQFLEDRRGNFWLMSDSGILRVGKSELNRFADGIINKVHCTSFGISDGLKSLEFDNKFSRNSVLKTGKGDFRFITKKGISIVNPEKININKLSPPAVIEAVFFNDRFFSPYLEADAYSLKGIKHVSFRFTVPTFLSPGKIRFEYLLQGFDREWTYLLSGKERAAFYKALPPGTYTFKVRACSAEGVWDQTGDSLTFTLEPIFYQTLLFKIAVVVFLLVLFAAAFYIYKKRPFKRKAKYKSSSLHRDFADECIEKLRKLMENEKVYVDAGISLQSLAGKLSIPPHLLSQLLNERLRQNYFDFINSYRIEEVKMILKSPKGERQKIDAVAFEVGFNTMAAFYKAFKKYTGKTPTEYKEEAGKTK